MTVQEIFTLIDGLAPFETQMESDNSGLLVGDGNAPVTGILLALDLTPAVIDEALSLGVELIVTHHPLMFEPRHTLTEGDYEGRLIRRLVRGNLSFIAAHTNLDQSPVGTNAALCTLLGLREVSGEGFFRCGLLPEPMPAGQLRDHLSALLGDTVRLMGPADAPVAKIGMCSGGGSSEWTAALASGCQAFLTGEMKHHHALEIADSGLVAFECGHFATEYPGVCTLADALQKAFDEVQCKVRIFKSAARAYAFPRQP